MLGLQSQAVLRATSGGQLGVLLGGLAVKGFGVVTTMAWVQFLAWELLHAARVAKKNQPTKKKKKNRWQLGQPSGRGSCGGVEEPFIQLISLY